LIGIHDGIVDVIKLKCKKVGYQQLMYSAYVVF